MQVAILVDDMIDSGSTLSLATMTLHERGAKTIYALVSHGKLCGEPHTACTVFMLSTGLLSEANMSKIEELPIQQLVVRLSSYTVTMY
jgi:ribose-phosphate pyrophosphokinase